MDSVELQVPVLLPTDKESASQLLDNVELAIKEALPSPKSLGEGDGKSKFVCELKLDNPDRPFLVIKINLPACTYDHNILLENDVVDGAKLACYMAIHAILKVSKKRGIPLNPHEIFDTKSIALRMVTLTYFIENKDSNEALKILDAMNMRVSLLSGYRGVESRDADGILRKTTYRNNQNFGDMCAYIKGEKPAKKSHICLDRFETKVQNLLKNAAARFIRIEFKFSARNLSRYCWDSKKGLF